jgi:hypothetical protein
MLLAEIMWVHLILLVLNVASRSLLGPCSRMTEGKKRVPILLSPAEYGMSLRVGDAF